MIKKKVLFLILGFAVIGVIAVLYTFRSNPDSVKRVKADFEVAAIEIVAEFEENEEAASAKYIEKVLIIEGTMVEITKNKENRTIINLEGSFMGNVSCLMGEKQELPATLDAGQTLKIKGKCVGYTIDVVVKQCSFEK